MNAQSAMSTLTQEMFTALRRMSGNQVAAASDLGVNANTMQMLTARGFLIADTERKPFLYGLSDMGRGAVAILTSPVVPKDSEGGIARIQRVVSHYYSIPPLEMVSSRRARAVARPRQIAMYLCRILTPHSLPTIGHYFGGRDHTTVIHAIRTIEALREDDQVIESDLRDLLRGLDPEDDFVPPPIDRTPCFKCGTRADIGCVHTRVAA